MMHLLFLVFHGPFSICCFTPRWWAHSCTTSLPFKVLPFGSNFPLPSPCLSSLTSSPFIMFHLQDQRLPFFCFSVSYQRCKLAEAALFFSIGFYFTSLFFYAIIRLTLWVERLHPFSILIAWHSQVLFCSFTSPLYSPYFISRLDVCLCVSIAHFIQHLISVLFGRLLEVIRGSV